AVGAVRQLDHHFADTDDAARLLGHGLIRVVSAATILSPPQNCHACRRDAWPMAPPRPKSRPMRPALPINAVALQPSSLLLGVACGTGAAFCWAAGFVAARHGILKGLAPADIALHRFVWAGLALLPGVLANGFAEVTAIGWARALTLTLVAGPLQ